MNHPTIVTAFENAATRENDKIYITFIRCGIFYTDTYWILKGTKEEVEPAIHKTYKMVEEERRNCPQGYDIKMVDTPFDTWCDGSCLCYNVRCDSLLKCASGWSHIEHETEEELQEFIKNVTQGCYQNVRIEYMGKFRTNLL